LTKIFYTFKKIINNIYQSLKTIKLCPGCFTMNYFYYLIILIISFVVSVIIVPQIKKYCEKKGIYDYVNERKIHNGKIARLGGLGIFLGFVFAFIFVLIIDFKVKFNANLFILAMLIAFLTGFIDDVYKIKARYKLILQLISGYLVAFSGLQFEGITLISGLKISFGYFGYIVTILWVTGFMNAINLLDGMDGLASGIVMIASIFIAIIGLIQNNIVVVLLSFALFGSIAGFFVYNYPPAKIFMGDGGAYFLGFMYSVLPLIGIKKASTITVFLIPLVLLLIPIMDMLFVAHNRFKNGYNIFIADKNHIHHKLMRVGFSNRGILWILYAYTAILGCFSILMLYVKPVISLIILLLLILITFLTFYTVSVAENFVEKNGHNS